MKPYSLEPSIAFPTFSLASQTINCSGERDAFLLQDEALKKKHCKIVVLGLTMKLTMNYEVEG